MRMKNYQPEEYLEKELLNLVGNRKPTVYQLNLMKKLVGETLVVKRLQFDVRLCFQERNCLFCAALGYSTKETAALLQCEMSKIKYYREEILRKLNCANMAQAVFVGIKLDNLV